MSNKRKDDKTTYTTRYFNRLRPPRLDKDGYVLGRNFGAVLGYVYDVGELSRPWNRAVRRERAAGMRELYRAYRGDPED